MAKRRKFKIPFPKINDDFMTTVVVFSLGYCVRMIEKGMALSELGLDGSAVIAPGLTVFGVELAGCILMKVYERKVAADDRRAEEARERRKQREERKEKDRQEKELFLKEVGRDENG